MTQNTSSKICISKRLTITALLLTALGFSIVVFSTLSSSINKTTSSKAESPASETLRGIGGQGQPCVTESNEIYSCKAGSGLVCYAPLDFWLRSTSQTSDTESKCIGLTEVPVGIEGSMCRDIKEKLGGSERRCNKGLVCIRAFDDSSSVTNGMAEYLSLTVNRYVPELANKIARNIEFRKDNYLLLKFLKYYLFYDDKRIEEPHGICAPDKLSEVRNCGDVNQEACNSATGRPQCLDNSRVVYNSQRQQYMCVPKINIAKQSLIKCDDRISKSCNEFCASNNLKCVETCEDKTLVTWGDESKDMLVRAGMFDYFTYDGGKTLEKQKVNGSCDYLFTSIPKYDDLSSAPCTGSRYTRCCCDKIK